MRTQHQAWLGNFFERSMEHETPLMSGYDFANTKISAVGYQVGMSNPCLYMHGTEPSIGWRHGDDILFAGEEKLLTVSMTS